MHNCNTLPTLALSLDHWKLEKESNPAAAIVCGYRCAAGLGLCLLRRH